jgi:hypothetical protein
VEFHHGDELPRRVIDKEQDGVSEPVAIKMNIRAAATKAKLILLVVITVGHLSTRRKHATPPFPSLSIHLC